MKRSQAKIRPKQCRYYDLIHVPHGHIPAPKSNLWSKFPIPIKEFRDEDFYFCPICHEPSFFKINYACNWCEDEFFYGGEDETYAYLRYKRRRRREYFRELKKRIEYLFLPFLVFFGKAWYVRSTRQHWKDRR